ncbi:adenosylcobinamide-GDP ribazoletransferase [Ornithinimicrobium sp. W1679]|uniref:adenosylcobinamide-GDP ribazoletransferase n=1 Tax=Ornithinimicrobium sp. W1679 TaxID=3418770 RepID=UPI003CEE5234
MGTGFLDAVAFLTRVPVRRRAGGGGTAGGGGSGTAGATRGGSSGEGTDRAAPVDLARAAVWFPVVGALLGATALLLGFLLATWTGVLVAVVLVLVVEQLLTGALHLDGLADLADASGGRDRAARLRIMRDHATGVYGTTAVVLALLLEGALLVEVLTAGAVTGPASGILGTGRGADGPAGWLAAALLGATAWSLSRAAMLPVALLLPYAREDGTGRAVVQGLALRHTLLAWVVPVLLCALLGWTGAAMLLAALGAALVVGAHARRTLGGATGDVLGATAQLALPAALLAAVLTL